MIKYAAPRGMRDFYPEDYRVRDTLFNNWKKTALQHGFEFYDSPIVETLDLLERKSGEEISEQIYTFEDKSGRRLALRPELTPSLARLIISKQKALNFPIKWAAIGQCFRYERMTRGRKREHYQWNLDIIGEQSVMAEAEVISTAVDSMRNLGLQSNDFKVHIGSRAIIGELFKSCDIDKKYFAACFLVIDKKGKIDNEQMTELMKKEGLQEKDIVKIFEILSITSLDQVIKQLGENNWAVKEIQELFAISEIMDFRDFLKFDISIIRGLDYYTGIVFEAFDVNKKLRALFGGGRYNSLLSKLGGEIMPSVGLGFGDVVILELLNDLNKAPQSSPSVDYSVGFMDMDSRNFAISIASSLRAEKFSCDLSLKPEKAKQYFKKANRIGALNAILIGQNEASSGTYKIKNMKTGEVEEKTLDSE